MDNAAMGAFFSATGGPTARMLRFGHAYHELLIESAEIFSEAVEEISRFLALKSVRSGGGASGRPRSASVFSSLYSMVFG